MQILLSKCVSILIALTLMLSLAGCYQIEKIINKGTVKGVSLCIDHNTSTLLSEELVKRKCIKENQTKLQYKIPNLSASISIRSKEDRSKGFIELYDGRNTNDDYIITEILVDIGVYDKDGKQYFKTEYIETWIEPSVLFEGLSSTIEKFDLPANTTSGDINKQFCSEVVKKSCRDWGIRHISGVKI